MPASPTQLTLKKLRKDGYLAAVTEHWNPFAKIRQDLFGVIDVLGVSEAGVIAVQATSYSNMSHRVKKITDHASTPFIRDAGIQLEVWGWRKVKNRWVCRVVDVS